MKQVPFLTEFYIARLHGRAEVPETMVLDNDDYARIRDNAQYHDLVRHILTGYRCLFIGFSFVDPAIKRILEFIEERLSPNFPKEHLALLPNDADGDFISQLGRFNIRTIIYNSADGHASLWEAITLAARELTPDQKANKPLASFPLDNIQRFLATSYARAKVSEGIQPLRDTLVDGIILGILTTNGNQGARVEDIANDLREYLQCLREKVSKS